MMSVMTQRGQPAQSVAPLPAHVGARCCAARVWATPARGRKHAGVDTTQRARLPLGLWRAPMAGLLERFLDGPVFGDGDGNGPGAQLVEQVRVPSRPSVPVGW